MTDEALPPRNMGRRATDHDDLPSAIKSAIKEALTEVLKDPNISKAFWKQGYEEFTNHAGNSASQWVGRRILTAAVTFIFGVALVYLVKQGAIK